jgi:hypothetical protein
VQNPKLKEIAISGWHNKHVLVLYIPVQLAQSNEHCMQLKPEPDKK